MLDRDIVPELLSLVKQYPVVTLMGPRQSGKTTLVKNVFPKKFYVNLEEPDTREMIVSDPRRFFAQHPDGAILDEIQRAPILLSYIQGIVDEKLNAGMFILTGSHQLQLHEGISQSLAGRTAILELLPLTLHELQKNNIDLSIDEYLFNGFYPRIYQQELNPTVAYRNYIKTYLERDVRQLIHLKEMTHFQKFLHLCVGRIGNILNAESLANEVGVAGNTIRQWLSILEASYLLVRLQPYFENFGKRVIKSPKLYFNDVGLIAYLIGIESIKHLARDPLRGSLFENMVLLELIKARLNKGSDPHLYYYRDNHQNEVDVIIKQGHRLIPIEIKSAETFNVSMLRNLEYFKKLVGDRCTTGFLIYGGSAEQSIGDFQVLNYKNTHRVYELIESVR